MLRDAGHDGERRWMETEFADQIEMQWYAERNGLVRVVGLALFAKRAHAQFQALAVGTGGGLRGSGCSVRPSPGQSRRLDAA